MRRLTAALITIALTSGCATRSGNRSGVNAGGLAMGAGIVMLVVSGIAYVSAVKPLCGTGPTPVEDGACDVDRGRQRASTIGAIVGAALLVGGLVVLVPFAVANQELRDRELKRERADAWQRAEEERIERERRRNQIWTLTKQAAEAARAGDCEIVVARGREVFALDPEFHYTVFTRDVAVGGCLAKAGIRTSIAPPPPPPPPRDRVKDREQAFKLNKAAADAARAGNCATALENEGKIRELDANVHDAWFVRDAAIKRCLDAAK